MAAEPLCVLVVDDEPPARDEIAYLLAQDERTGEILASGSGADALRVLEERPVDAIFVDIAMPGFSGMDLARVVARFRVPPSVVFITAHDDHAVEAFDVQAVDYVLKPVREERLREAVRRVVDALGAGAPEPDETIAVELGGVTRFVNRRDIRYVEAQGDYARLHTHRGSHLVRIPLATLEQRWEEHGFLRIHRSLLVNTAHVDEIRADHGRFTVVVDGAELRAARRHSARLRELIAPPTGREHRNGEGSP